MKNEMQAKIDEIKKQLVVLEDEAEQSLAVAQQGLFSREAIAELRDGIIKDIERSFNDFVMTNKYENRVKSENVSKVETVTKVRKRKHLLSRSMVLDAMIELEKAERRITSRTILYQLGYNTTSKMIARVSSHLSLMKKAGIVRSTVTGTNGYEWQRTMF